MIENIAVAERTRNLLCQDTGIPIYNVTIGRDVRIDGVALKEAIRRGVERATREHPLRSSVVHPITRMNEQTSCGRLIPVINIDFDEAPRQVRIEMIPKGSGSENGSFLKMLIPADGVDGIKTFVDRPRDRGRRPGLPADHRRRRHRRHLGPLHAPRQGRGDAPARLGLRGSRRREAREELSIAVNSLGIGPQGLGGRGTAFAVHVETAATHITMNPVAVNIQCHSARRASAVISGNGVEYGF